MLRCTVRVWPKNAVEERCTRSLPFFNLSFYFHFNRKYMAFSVRCLREWWRCFSNSIRNCAIGNWYVLKKRSSCSRLLPNYSIHFSGRPMYYFEMAIGQFCSRSSVKMYNVCPLFRGMKFKSKDWIFNKLNSFRCWCWTNSRFDLSLHLLLLVNCFDDFLFNCIIC